MAAFSWTDVNWGQVADPDDINRMAHAVQDFANPYRAVLRQTVAQNLTNNAVSIITFDVEDYDNANGHDLLVNNSRWYVPVDGWYQLSGGISFASNSSNIRTSQWFVNGSDIAGGQVKVNATSGATTVLPTKVLDVPLTTGQYVELGAFQNSGGLLATSVILNEQPIMQIRLLSRI